MAAWRSWRAENQAAVGGVLAGMATRTGSTLRSGPTMASAPGRSAGRSAVMAPKRMSVAAVWWARVRARAPWTRVLRLRRWRRAKSVRAAVAAGSRVAWRTTRSAAGGGAEGMLAVAIGAGVKPARWRRQAAAAGAGSWAASQAR